jgi:hypothetical protein
MVSRELPTKGLVHRLEEEYRLDGVYERLAA